MRKPNVSSVRDAWPPVPSGTISCMPPSRSMRMMARLTASSRLGPGHDRDVPVLLEHGVLDLVEPLEPVQLAGGAEDLLAADALALHPVRVQTSLLEQDHRCPLDYLLEDVPALLREREADVGRHEGDDEDHCV